MTEKRFTISDTDVLCMTIIDNENGKHYGFARDIAIVMNDLNDENKQLKEEIIQIEKNHDDFYDKVVFEINQSIQYFELKTGCHDETINELRRLKEVLTEWSV